MRMSLLQSFNQGLRSILDMQSRQAHTQNQVATGRRVLQPSDDPLAAARILQVEREQSRLTQFQKNIDGVESSLMLEDTQLDAVGNLLIRVRELATRAGNGSLGYSERQGLAAELETRLAELLNLANTRNTTGEYIFGGYQGEQPPFVKAEGEGNHYHYRGDDGQRLVQVASSTWIAAGDNGQSLFVAVPSPRLATAAALENAGNATISSGQVVDQEMFQAHSGSRYEIRFLTPEPPADPTGPPDHYEVVAIHADGSNDTLVTSAPFVSGEPILVNGVELRIIGEPATGDRFTIQPPATQGILDTVAKLAAGLRDYGDSPDDKLRLSDLISESLDHINQAEAHISVARAQIGARLNTLDSTRELHSGTALVHEEVLKDIRDLDYAEALTRLTMENFVLEAARQSFTKISNLSLFNFMR